MKAFRFEQPNHSGPTRSIRPGAVNQDNVFGPLRGVRLSESSRVESVLQDQHHRRDQSVSVRLRELHFHLLVKPTVAIKPEQPWPHNWTKVSPIRRYRRYLRPIASLPHLWPNRNNSRCTLMGLGRPL
jgi:hypothetical protein